MRKYKLKTVLAIVFAEHAQERNIVMFAQKESIVAACGRFFYMPEDMIMTGKAGGFDVEENVVRFLDAQVKK